MTSRLDLDASRNETWARTIEYGYSGDPLPLTGATMRLQWRLYPGADGAALIDLEEVDYLDAAATEEDVAENIAPVGGRVLRIFPGPVSIATLQALPTGLNQPEAGEADRYHWDVTITYADTFVERLIAGEVLVDPGTTLEPAP